MIKLIILLISILISGCAGDRGSFDSNNHGYGWKYDYETLEGVRIRNKSTSFTPNSEMIDALYLSVKSCVGLTFDINPLMILQDINPTDGYGGIAYFDTYLIVINVDHVDWYNYQLLNHELIHVFLAAQDFDNQLNSDHKSPYFATCIG